MALAGVTLVLCQPSTASPQVLELTNDQGTVLSGVQQVNVGEHVRLAVQSNPPATLTNVQWIVTGAHIKDWVTKDSAPVPMAVSDYLGDTLHVIWKDTTTPFAPNVVHVSASVGGSVLMTELQFQVERQPKAEKFYSDDLLMENHNNWHSVYMFWAASTRRGDLFLGWHRSQLDHFAKWREYFGYPPVPSWNPTTAWGVAPLPPARRHPSSAPAPASSFSTRHDLVTLDLTDQGLTTATEGEFDLVTQAQGRGTNAAFASGGHVLTTEAVRAILCEDPGFPCDDPAFARNGAAGLPTWWAPDTGQTAADLWFEAGCPARATEFSMTTTSTCAADTKTSFSDYNLRELGESIESGLYATDFMVNYHALAHVAASGDMANPATSMRDPVFWAWHKHIDSILTSWQATQGVEAGGLMLYQLPSFSAGWDTVRVPFSNATIPELVLPGNLTVNGSPATTVVDVFTATGGGASGPGYVYEFSGFAVPPSGPVEVVLSRELDNTIRTSASDLRPTPTLIMSVYGRPLEPAVNRITYTRP
jgi:Common central domain of tyrosinase